MPELPRPDPLRTMDYIVFLILGREILRALQPFAFWFQRDIMPSTMEVAVPGINPWLLFMVGK